MDNEYLKELIWSVRRAESLEELARYVESLINQLIVSNPTE